MVETEKATDRGEHMRRWFVLPVLLASALALAAVGAALLSVLLLGLDRRYGGARARRAL